MSAHKYMDRICVVAVVLSFLLTVVCMNGEALGIRPASRTMGYEENAYLPYGSPRFRLSSCAHRVRKTI